ncbi:hypothetical protein [Secundilactobacillus oryzae]|nr:hypothetical protein [Secundilactobacillus oryzae]
MSTIAEKLKLNKYHEIVIQKLPKSVAPLFEEVDYHTEPSDQTDFF